MPSWPDIPDEKERSSVIEGLVLWEIRPNDESSPRYRITVEFEPVEGDSLLPVGIQIRLDRDPDSGWAAPPLDSVSIRSVRWGQVLTVAREKALEILRGIGLAVGAIDPAVWDLQPLLQERVDEMARGLRPVGRPPVHGDEHWQEVAATYQAALGAGDRAPTKAVAKVLAVSHSTAADWVATCRKRGLLPSTRRGVARG